MLGQPAEGLKSLAEAAQIIETTEERVAEVELHRVRGDLLNATGDQSGAERNSSPSPSSRKKPIVSPARDWLPCQSSHLIRSRSVTRFVPTASSWWATPRAYCSTTVRRMDMKPIKHMLRHWDD